MTCPLEGPGCETYQEEQKLGWDELAGNSTCQTKPALLKNRSRAARHYSARHANTAFVPEIPDTS